MRPFPLATTPRPAPKPRRDPGPAGRLEHSLEVLDELTRRVEAVRMVTPDAFHALKRAERELLDARETVWNRLREVAG